MIDASTLPDREIELLTLYWGTRGPRHAKILVVAESYGKTERAKNQPLVGMSGEELSKILVEVDIDERDCLFTNVVNLQPFANRMETFFYPTKEAKTSGMKPYRGLYPRQEILDGLSKLQQIIDHTKPEIIIGLGNYTLWALTDDLASFVG